MKWILLLLTTVHAAVETSKVLYCVPVKIVEWDKESLLQTTQECLDNNFIHHHGDINAWGNAYMEALDAKKHSDNEEQLLMSARRELVLTLRDVQVKVTHHTHAVEKCASLANKMPQHIVEEYTKEMDLAMESTELWLHHTREDLKHCVRVLHDVVARQQQHLQHHLIDDYVIFTKQLQHTEAARVTARQTLDTMIAKRDELIGAA